MVAEKLFEQDRLQTYSILLFRVQATYKIMQRTTEQWVLFNRDKEKWLGNIVMKYGRPIESYRNMPKLGLNIMIRSVQSVTWNRTQQIYKMHAIACCLDSDMIERTQLKKFLKESNMVAKDLEELEQMVKKYLREMKKKKGENEVLLRRQFISSLQ